MAALILLESAMVDSGQRVSILATASPASHLLNSIRSTDDILDQLDYVSVATVFCQCDDHEDKKYYYTLSSAFILPLHSTRLRGKLSSQHNPTRERNQHIKNNHPCVRCGEYGY